MKNQKSRTSGLLATLRSALPPQRAAESSSNPQSLAAYQLPRHMHHNRREIENSSVCGCISCEQMFSKDEIRTWVAAGATAVCPHCDAAAVVGLGGAFEFTSELLHRAHLLLFEGMGLRIRKPGSKLADPAELMPLRASRRSAASA
jgi:hypothetical protein